MLRRRETLFWWLVGAALLLFAWAGQGLYARFPRGWLTDDSYFYLQIARNIARSGHSSFDGIHLTDGYQLAWGWLLAAVSWLAGRVSWGSAWQMGAMVGFYLLLLLLMGRLFATSRIHALWLVATGIIFKMMMETTLLALVLLILARDRFLAESEEAPRWRTSLLLVLVPLIRIDATLIAGVCSLGQWVRDRSFRELSWNVGWLAAGTLLQLFLMKLLLGSWLSVSSEVKASSFEWAQLWINVQENLTGNYYANLLSWAVALSFWGAASLGLGFPRNRQDWSRHVVLAAPLIFVLFHLVANNTLRYWYFVPLLCFSVWMSGAYPSPDRRIVRLTQAVFAAAVLAFVLKTAADTVVRQDQIRWSARFVSELQEQVEEDTLIFQVDASGWVAWHSERRVVNGDGLVNTHAFAQRIRENRLSGYLEEEGIGWIVSNQYPRNGLVLDWGGLRTPLDSVDVVIAPPEGYPQRTAFGLYRLR